MREKPKQKGRPERVDSAPKEIRIKSAMAIVDSEVPNKTALYLERLPSGEFKLIFDKEVFPNLTEDTAKLALTRLV